jgi:hypothetical protein
MTTADERGKFLRLYLDDHLAGATAGMKRAERLADAEAASQDGPVLKTFATDVVTDREALLALMEVLDVQPSPLKTGIAAVGEKLGALKPNGRVVERSPLTTVVELEAMQMAVRGKRSLWETLRGMVPSNCPIDVDSLIARADDQLDVLAGLHADRVVVTFAVSSS